MVLDLNIVNVNDQNIKNIKKLRKNKIKLQDVGKNVPS